MTWSRDLFLGELAPATEWEGLSSAGFWPAPRVWRGIYLLRGPSDCWQLSLW